MERYLLFDSGCRICTQLAQDIERESGGWLKAHTLRDPAMLDMVRKAQPDWQWQPTLLEIEGDQINVATGPILMTRVVLGVGPRRAWRIAKLVRQAHIGTRYINHGRRQFLYTGGAFLASLPLLGVSSLHSDLSSPDISNLTWQTYKDPDLGFTLQYPVDYQAETKHEQPKSVINDEAILKRVIFSSFPSLVYLDIWLTKDKNLSDWLTWYKETREVRQMSTETNATVAAKPAVTFLQENERDLMITYFSDGVYVYRLLNWMTNNSTDLDVYWHMLDTFVLPGKNNSTKAEHPFVGNKTVNQVVAPQLYIATCCNYYDYGNPFPCCTEGNCTWWVYYKMGYVPFTGHAYSWWGDSLNYHDWGRSSQPSTSVDSIGCWHIDQDRPSGHVAYAATYSGSGQVTVTHMHCDTAGRHCKSTDPINTTDPTQGWLIPLY